MKKPIALVLLAFGTLCFFLALYQFNQYYTAQAAIGPALGQLDALTAAGGLEAAGLTAADLEGTRATITGTTNAMLVVMLIDIVLGMIFLAVGFSIYPKER
jgi:hypothetical protein